MWSAFLKLKELEAITYKGKKMKLKHDATFTLCSL